MKIKLTLIIIGLFTQISLAAFITEEKRETLSLVRERNVLCTKVFSKYSNVRNGDIITITEYTGAVNYVYNGIDYDHYCDTKTTEIIKVTQIKKEIPDTVEEVKIVKKVENIQQSAPIIINTTPSTSTLELYKEYIKAEVIKDLKSKEEVTKATPNIKISKTLKFGDKNNDVKTLQNILGVEETGFYGNKTKEKVILFQKNNKILQTGNVGPITLIALNKYANSK